MDVEKMNELSEQMQAAMDRLVGCDRETLITSVMLSSAKVLLAYGRLLIETGSFDKARDALDTADAIMAKINAVMGDK